MVSSHSHGEFPVGKTEVKVVAIDESGNNSTCVLEIVVEGLLKISILETYPFITWLLSYLHSVSR